MVKQREAELPLEGSNLYADGRRRHAVAYSRLRKGAVVEDGAECFEEPYIHLSIRSRYCQGGAIMPVSPRHNGLDSDAEHIGIEPAYAASKGRQSGGDHDKPRTHGRGADHRG